MKTPSQKYASKTKKLKKEADTLFQQVGLLIHPFCVVCGRDATVRHHFIAKSLSSALRHDIQNGVSLCWFHHQRFHATVDPETYEKMVGSMTAKQIEHLKEKRREVLKPSQANYIQAIDELKIAKEKL